MREFYLKFKQLLRELLRHDDPKIKDLGTTMFYYVDELASNYQTYCESYANKIVDLSKTQSNPLAFLEHSLEHNLHQTTPYYLNNIVEHLSTPFSELSKYIDLLKSTSTLLNPLFPQVFVKILELIPQFENALRVAITEENKKLYKKLARTLINQISNDTQTQQINNNNNSLPTVNNSSKAPTSIIGKRVENPNQTESNSVNKTSKINESGNPHSNISAQDVIINNNSPANTNNANNEINPLTGKSGTSYQDVIGIRSAYFKIPTIKKEPEENKTVTKNPDNNLNNNQKN